MPLGLPIYDSGIIKACAEPLAGSWQQPRGRPEKQNRQTDRRADGQQGWRQTSCWFFITLRLRLPSSHTESIPELMSVFVFCAKTPFHNLFLIGLEQ